MTRLRSAAAPTGAALALTALLAACGGGGATALPEADPSLTLGDPPSASAPPVPVEEPALPPPTDDVAGRKAFAEYVARAWEYASVTNDPSALLEADPGGTCEGCRDAARAFRERAGQDWHIDDLGMDIGATDVTARDGRVTVVGMAVAFERNRAVDDDGSVRARNPAQKHLYFEVGMTFEGDHYQITDYEISE